MALAPGLVAGWTVLQREFATRRTERPLLKMPRFVAGVDCAFPAKDTAQAAAVVYDRERREIIEQVVVRHPVTSPYIPGYLSFREGPAIQVVLAKLKHPFAAVLFDGQGLAHPRRCGLATHLGVELGLLTVGVAKSLYVGTFTEPDREAGSTAPLVHKGDRVGTVLRTRDGVRPLFISPGNGVDHAGAVELTLACVTRYRLPEPTRVADQLSRKPDAV